MALAEKHFGVHNAFTITKTAPLAVIYAEIGQPQKAEPLMQRCITDVDTNPNFRNTRSYVHALNGRMLASEHKYKEALKEAAVARDTATNKSEKQRACSELIMGLADPVSKKQIEIEQAKNYLQKKEFARLDALMNQARNAKSHTWSGKWTLDSIYSAITPDSEDTDEQLTRRTAELNTWLQRNPSSPSARVAVAESLIEHAWKARGTGWANTVSDEGWKKYGQRLTQAKNVLDGDPKLLQKCPSAFASYITIGLGLHMDKPTLLNLADRCHKTWPDYREVDFSACHFLLPRWHGNEGDIEKYIVETSKLSPGAKGDARCAQMVWRMHKYLPDLCKPGNPVKWDKVSSGFNELIAEYPSDIKPRIAMLEVANELDQWSGTEKIFDGYKP